ncbi:F-box domain-containing protein [Phlyctema vagabunda]|uniref:F-box domain-containing protein n=1 Tax=Phlyctema vagabunda TaxID=108571 RepID=A0ABR4P4G4_9HELO
MSTYDFLQEEERRVRVLHDQLAIGDRRVNFVHQFTASNCYYPIRHLQAEQLLACPLDNGRHKPRNLEESSIGIFGSLPPELFNAVLANVDIASLTTMRTTSWAIRATIDDMASYKAIFKHAPHTLRAVLSLKIGSSITCQQLFDQLCRQKCTTCNNFGAFLYLLTCERVCFFCFTSSESRYWLSWEQGEIRAAFGDKYPELLKLPTARVLPGDYGYAGIYESKRRPRVVSARVATEVGTSLLGSKIKFERARRREFTHQRKEYLRETSRSDWPELSVRDPSEAMASRVVIGTWRHTKSGLKGMDNPRRFMCIISFPWLNLNTNAAECGVMCRACYQQLEDTTPDEPGWEAKFAKMKSRKMYSHDDMIAHMADCTYARVELDKFIADIGTQKLRIVSNRRWPVWRYCKCARLRAKNS